MSTAINDSNNDKREQWEQREHVSDGNTCNRSQSNSIIGNGGNKLTTVIVNPIDTAPAIAPTPVINRPCYMSHVDWFTLNGKVVRPGLYYHGENHQDEKPVPTDEWLCSPLFVKAITASSNGDEFGRLLRFIDSNGKWHEWAMPMYMLKGYGEELRGELLNQGVTFNPKKRTPIIEFLMNARPKRRIIAASKVGWHENTFILPNQVIGKDDVVFQSEVAGENDFLTAGSIDGWQDTIGKKCAGNIPLLVSVSTVLAGPLLKLVNRQQGGGVHWVGDSSIGKSTAVEIAASVWGPPEFIRSWSGTANGLEGAAATRNDTCLILDEINEASPHEIGKIVYMLVNGQGKQRASRIGGARKIQRWRLMAVSTGEKTLESIMNEAGKQANSGQLVRLLNIPAAFKYGVFDDLHGFDDGRSLADYLKTARLKNYGHLGPAFVKKLVEDKRDLTDLLDRITKKIAASVSTNLEKRAAAVFAVIGMAGELGIEYGLLPWTKNSALDAATMAFTRWQQFQGAGQTEDMKILRAISDFISKHGDSRFSPIFSPENIPLYEADKKPVNNRAGWYKDAGKQRVFMLTPAGLQEAGGGYDKSRVVDALVRHAWIADKDPDRYTKKTRIPSGPTNLYHISIPEQENLI